MAIAGDLVVRLGLDGNKFQKGLQKASGETKSFSSSVASMLNPVTATIGTLAAGAASAGVAVYALTGRIAKLAGVADKATQTGLSGEFIQRLGYAADQSGVSAETLTASINKMTVAIGKGGKEFEHLKGLSPEAQFLSIADRISKLPTHADRAAAAVKVFGRSGIEMTGLFAGGLNDVNKLLADAKALGIGLSDEALAKAAKADDAIQRMYASFGALFDQVAVSVAPIFDDIATAIGNWAPPLTAFMDKFNELPDKAKFIGDVFESSLDVAFLAIEEKWNVMLDGMLRAAAKKATGIGALLLNPGGAGAAIGARIGGGVERSGNLEAAQAKLKGLFDQLTPEEKPPWQGPKQTAGGNPAAQAAQNKFRDGVAGFWDKLQAPIAEAQMGAQGIFDRAKIKGNAMMGTLENIFTGTPEEKVKQAEPQLAGAMQKGSQEAYSTIVQAMIRQRDPVENAVRNSGREIVKAIKSRKEVQLAYVAAFDGVGSV